MGSWSPRTDSVIITSDAPIAPNKYILLPSAGGQGISFPGVTDSFGASFPVPKK